MLRKTFALSWLFVAGVILLSGCKAYKQDILFRLDDDFSEEDLSGPIEKAEGNYVLKVNDQIIVDVFTNDGERIIDPNNELNQGQGMNNRQNQNIRQFPYLIQANGTVKLPKIDTINLVGLTIYEAEQVLQEAYNAFYKECFVRLQVTNRRVTVLGANGGQVIPLENEKTTVAEVIALYGGVEMGTRANNVRLIRGDLKNPEVYMMDLTTIAGMRSTVIEVQPGDIIYVEPWRRAWLVGLRDISPVLSITSSILAFVLVLQNLNR